MSTTSRLYMYKTYQCSTYICLHTLIDCPVYRSPQGNEVRGGFRPGPGGDHHWDEVHGAARLPRSRTRTQHRATGALRTTRSTFKFVHVQVAWLHVVLFCCASGGEVLEVRGRSAPHAGSLPQSLAQSRLRRGQSGITSFFIYFCNVSWVGMPIHLSP